MGDMVIALASGGQPLKRILCGTNRRLAYLANPDLIREVEAGESDPVGYPIEDVFLFSEPVFDTVCQMWEQSRSVDPSRLRKKGDSPAALGVILFGGN